MSHYTSLMRSLTGLWPPPTPQTLSNRTISLFMVSKTEARSRAALKHIQHTFPQRYQHYTLFNKSYPQCTKRLYWNTDTYRACSQSTFPLYWSRKSMGRAWSAMARAINWPSIFGGGTWDSVRSSIRSLQNELRERYVKVWALPVEHQVCPGWAPAVVRVCD